MDFGSVLNKIKENFLLIPEEKFDRVASDTSYTDSLVYLAVCIFVGAIIAVPFSLFFSVLSKDPAAGMMAAVLSVPLSLVMVPFMYVGYGIMHLLLKLVGGRGSFLQTAQIFIYGTTGNNLLRGVPLVSFIFSLIGLVNVILGAKRVHQISLLKAILAIVVIPFVVFGLIIGAMVLLFGAALLGALGLGGMGM